LQNKLGTRGGKTQEPLGDRTAAIQHANTDGLALLSTAERTSETGLPAFLANRSCNEQMDVSILKILKRRSPTTQASFNRRCLASTIFEYGAHGLAGHLRKGNGNASVQAVSGRCIPDEQPRRAAAPGGVQHDTAGLGPSTVNPVGKRTDTVCTAFLGSLERLLFPGGPACLVNEA